MNVCTCRYTPGTCWPSYILICARKGMGKGWTFSWLAEFYIVDLSTLDARELCCTQKHLFLFPSLSPECWSTCSRDVVCCGQPCVHVLLSSQSLVGWALGWEPPSWCLISIVNDPPVCPVWVSDGLLTHNVALISKAIGPIWSVWQFTIPVKYISIQHDPAESQCRLEIGNVSLCSMKDTI